MTDDYFYLPSVFDNPEAHIPLPSDEELKNDTKFPEMNSRAYYYEAKKQYRKPTEFLPFFCHLEFTGDYFLLATNNFNSSVFDGSLIGAAHFEPIASHIIADASFQVPQEATITTIKHLRSDFFVIATKNSKIKLFSTRLMKQRGGALGLCASRGTNSYGMSISKLYNDNKFVLGTYNGHLELHDFEIAELMINRSYDMAHGASITGVAAHPSAANIFATCSNDRNCVLWDMRNEKSGLRILKQYSNWLTTIHWTTQEESNELLLVGDEAGNVLTLDARKPNTILNKIRVENRAVKKFCFNGKRLGVVTETNSSNYFAIDKGVMTPLLRQPAPGIVYSMCSSSRDQNDFYVVGEEQYAEKVSFV